ncbi:unnamed protein product [Cylicocyclus nassatus]|uniref:Uncharacterized protein n=1 Tax=Cylicocyclus nassatus TaxID=53992 RepID=A0AA36DRL9_CYLNA|nr:unnamed protein product [Cylicocyclus nassatus]
MLLQIIVDSFLYLLGLTALFCSLLCVGAIIAMWRSRGSRMFSSFYYRCCWNESWINLFTLIFFLTTMYARFFPILYPAFYYLNRFKWWTNFAQVTKQHVLYLQIWNVLVTVGGRFCTICLPHSIITHTAEQMNTWIIFILQTFFPTVTAIPLYCICDHVYRLKNVTVPLFLSSTDPTFGKVLNIVGYTYRYVALVLSALGYISMFCLMRKKANRNEMRVLIHGGSLLSALLASIISMTSQRLGIGSGHELMQMFYFTTFLWVPFTDIVITFWIVASLRHTANPFKNGPRTKTSITNSKIALAPPSRQ